MSAEAQEIVEAEAQEVSGKHREISFSQEEIQTLRNTVAKQASEDEFKMFMSLAQRYGLDPFNKEIFFFKVKGSCQIMTSRDGYLKIADRHPEYDGLVSDVVRKEDDFRRTTEGIEHEYGTDRGDIIGAYALVYRKDRSYPVYVFAPFDEYNADTRVWNNYPSAMILKCAESMALKRAFTVTGLVSKAEMHQIQQKSMDDSVADGYDTVTDSNRSEISDTATDRTEEEVELTEREAKIKEIVGGQEELKEELFEFLAHVKEKREMDKISLNDLTDEEYEEIKAILLDIKSLLSKTA